MHSTITKYLKKNCKINFFTEHILKQLMICVLMSFIITHGSTRTLSYLNFFNDHVLC